MLTVGCVQAPADRGMESRKELWSKCQQVLLHAYKTGQVGELFTGANRVWPLVGTHFSKFIYAVNDLGCLAMKEKSVLAITEDEGKLPDDIIRLGVRATPDLEDALYMGSLVTGTGHV